MKRIIKSFIVFTIVIIAWWLLSLRMNPLFISKTNSVLDNFKTLIADIYSNMNLDVNKSIFKIEELKSTLPGNLPTETKKQTVLGMLPVVGLELDNVVQATNRRTDVYFKVVK